MSTALQLLTLAELATAAAHLAPDSEMRKALYERQATARAIESLTGTDRWPEIHSTHCVDYADIPTSDL